MTYWQICQAVLDSEKLSNHDKYWVLATMAEAHLGVGDEERAKQTLDEAFAVASAPWMRESTEEQVEKLRRLLTASPLRFIRAERV